jgi:hypothetical protein
MSRQAVTKPVEKKNIPVRQLRYILRMAITDVARAYPGEVAVGKVFGVIGSVCPISYLVGSLFCPAGTETGPAMWTGMILILTTGVALALTGFVVKQSLGMCSTFVRSVRRNLNSL